MTHTGSPLLLGAHMSIAGGLEKAIERGASIGCTCIQIFTKSNRQWQAKKITDVEATLFKKTAHDYGMPLKNIVVHASYLINVGSAISATREKSIAALLDELERCELLGLPYLVLHPGSSADGDANQTCNIIAKSLDTVLEQFNGSTMVLLETMAGQGNSVCYTFEQLEQIHNAMQHKKRVGFCVDTCHIFAAGYDLRTPAEYEAVWRSFDAAIGLDHLKAFHINDSKKGLGSKVDRHADIGKGELGLEPFRLLFNDPRFFHIPKLLETPETHEIMKDYERNMQTIKALLSPELKKKWNIQD